MMEDRWLSVEEIAEYLGVSKDTVYSWVTTKKMPAHRVGRLWKFKKDAVDAWVESGGAAASRASASRDGTIDASAPTSTGGRTGGRKRK